MNKEQNNSPVLEEEYYLAGYQCRLANPSDFTPEENGYWDEIFSKEPPNQGPSKPRKGPVERPRKRSSLSHFLLAVL